MKRKPKPNTHFGSRHCNPAGCQSFGAKRSYQLQQAPNPPSRRRRVRHFYEFTLYGWDRSQFRPN
ncbi:MAG: hypothetical protein KGM92_05700 [Acidobacteriota bacterium]|jgi:hypothetical protein|nr:hypothetical protein [Acidobacteriota bacterium]